MILNISTITQPHYSMDKLLRMFGANTNNLNAFRATDPQDMIFGLLNISSDASALGLVAGHSLTTKEVYSHVTKMLLRAGKLGILSLCKMDQSTWGLPSWIPDFLLARTRSIPQVLECFSASGSTQALSSFPNIFTTGTVDCRRKLLELSGLRMDVVCKTGRETQVSHCATHNLKWVPYMRSWFKDFERFLYKNGISAEFVRETGAVWRVPIADAEGSILGPAREDSSGKVQDPTMSSTRATEKTYESFLKVWELLSMPRYMFTDGLFEGTSWLHELGSKLARIIWTWRNRSQAAALMGYDVWGSMPVKKFMLVDEDYIRALQNWVARYRKAIWRMGVGV